MTRLLQDNPIAALVALVFLAWFLYGIIVYRMSR